MLSNVLAIRNEMRLPPEQRADALDVVSDPVSAGGGRPHGVLSSDEHTLKKVLNYCEGKEFATVSDVIRCKRPLKGNQLAVQRLFDLAQTLGFGTRLGLAQQQHGGPRSDALRLRMHVGSAPQRERVRFGLFVGDQAQGEDHGAAGSTDTTSGAIAPMTGGGRPRGPLQKRPTMKRPARAMSDHQSKSGSTIVRDKSSPERYAALPADEETLKKLLLRCAEQEFATVGDAVSCRRSPKGKQTQVQSLFNLAQSMGFGTREGSAQHQHGGSRDGQLRLRLHIERAPLRSRLQLNIFLGDTVTGPTNSESSASSSQAVHHIGVNILPDVTPTQPTSSLQVVRPTCAAASVNEQIPTPIYQCGKEHTMEGLMTCSKGARITTAAPPSRIAVAETDDRCMVANCKESTTKMSGDVRQAIHVPNLLKRPAVSCRPLAETSHWCSRDEWTVPRHCTL